jgi:kynurenine formamidase
MVHSSALLAADRAVHATPLSGRRIVDLSIPIELTDGDPTVRSVELWTHADGPSRIGGFLAPLITELRSQLARTGELHPDARDRVDADSFPDGLFLGNELMSLSNHAGTHLDAPFHYGPLCEGRPARRIDEIPLAWCFGDGVVLRFRDKHAGETISAREIEHQLVCMEYGLKPGDIVLIETGSDKLLGSPDYFTSHPAMSVEATRFLVERGVKVIGIDTNGFDLPPQAMVERYLRAGDTAELWPCHMYGRQREYLQIEGLGGLDQLTEPFGFQFACMPIKISGAGAGWVRAFALVND